MGKRKPAVVLTAGTLAVATLLGVGVTANAIENILTPTTTQSASRTEAIYPEGAWISVDGEWFEDFDPSDGLDDEDTSYADSAVWDVDGGSIQLHDLPAGWTVGTQMRVNQLTGEWSAFYLVEDESKTYRYYWYFDGADGITHTVDEMRGFTLTLNGEPVDCDPTKNVNVHKVYPSDYVGYEGQPSNWTIVQRDFSEGGVKGYEYVAYPTDTETPTITYRFWYDAPSPADELEGITAYLSDGSPVTGFNPKVSGTYDIPYDYDVELRNVPAGWTVDPLKKANGSWDIELKKGNGGRYFNYLFAVTEDYRWTYVVDQLQHVNITLPDGSPIEGFGWRGGRWTLPKGTTGVNLTGEPAGWNKNVRQDGDTWTVTVSSPDGSISVDYVFDVPHTYTADELSGITATANDTPVDGFTPTQSGKWTVPYGSTVSLKGIPEDWVTTHEDGTLTWTVTAPDNTVSVTYTFEYAAKPASKDDLKTVTATVKGQPVEGFDPVNGGTFTVPAGTTSVDLAGIPEGWESTELEDGRLGFRVASTDGTLSVEYVFVPEVVTHTVTFNSDGGTPVEAQTVNDGDRASEPNAPTREGYTFQGWWNGDAKYDFAQPVTGDLTLTAHWEQNAPVMHTVTFDTGEGGTPVDAQQVEDGMTVSQPDNPTRDGYRFDGWLLDGQPYDFATQVHGDITLTAAWTALHTVTFDYAHDGMTGTQTIPDGEKATQPETPKREGWVFNGWLLNGAAYSFDTPVTGDITLTADWTRITHTVTFDTGEGSGIDPQTVNHGEQAIDPGTPTREGYTFTGWLLDGSPYDFSTPVTGDITLTAAWEKTPDPTPVTHTVTFDAANGGDPVKVAVVDGETVGKPADPTRDGYTFQGWVLDGEPYNFDTPVTGDITLTAAWEKLAEYTVTFDTQGGTPVEPQTITENGMVARPADPTREGYSFKGWQLDGRGYDFSTPVTGDITLTAVWEENEPPTPVEHTVTVNPNNGAPSTTYTITDGDTFTPPETPAREGYQFVGWTVDGQPYDFSQPVTGDITIEAAWEKIAVYTVTFDTQGGSAIPPQTVFGNDKATLPSPPIREGYEFKGWQLNGKDYDFNTPVVGDITLTAVWEETTEPAPVTHKVTVNPNNGGKADVYEVEDGKPFAQPADPTRDGYTFKGWVLDGKPYDFSQPVTGDITLEAQWEKNETPAPVTHTVKFRTNGGSAITAQTIEDGKTVSKPADPTRPGYVFKGWTLDGQPYDFSTPVTGDIILDAQWEEAPVADPLSGVTATVDGKPLDGFDPTKDGKYHVSEGATVELSGVPEGWTATRRDTENGFTFTLSDGERTVVYTFVIDGDGEDKPGKPGEEEKPEEPGKPGDGDKPGTPENPGDQTNADGSDDAQTDAEGALATTGAGIIPAIIAGIAAFAAAIAGSVTLRLRRRKPQGADNQVD